MEGITWYHAKIGDLLSISDAKIRYGKSINKTVDVLSSYGESEALLKYSSGLRLYIGKTASRTWMRLKITFTGRTWLFIENYKFLLDGETYELPVGFDDVKRKTESEGVREITDTVVSHDLLPLVQTIAKAKKATVRFRGRDEFMERTITKAEKDAFKQMLELFNAFGGKID